MARSTAAAAARERVSAQLRMSSALSVALLLSCAAAVSAGGLIGPDGFLRDRYPVHEMPFCMRVRQVPGDGNCLFYAVAMALHHAETGDHVGSPVVDLRNSSLALRHMAVDMLTGCRNITSLDERLAMGNPRGCSIEPAGGLKEGFGSWKRGLYLEMGQRIQPQSLLKSVAQNYETSCELYCVRMRREGIWGGGPEIVALSNALKQPIHVYELQAAEGRFLVRLIARFGSPKFDRNKQPIHILSADSRFPSVRPGDQALVGNHFLALFPEDEEHLEHMKPPTNVLQQFKESDEEEEEGEDEEASAPQSPGDAVVARTAATKVGGGGWFRKR